MELKPEGSKLQVSLETLDHQSEVESLKIIQKLGTSLKQDLQEPLRWKDDFKLQLQLIYAYALHLIQTDPHHSQKLSYLFSITVLRSLSQPSTVSIEKQTFADQALKLLLIQSRENSLDSHRITRASYLASLSSHQSQYESLFEASLKESRAASLGDRKAHTRT